MLFGDASYNCKFTKSSYRQPFFDRKYFDIVNCASHRKPSHFNETKLIAVKIFEPSYSLTQTCLPKFPIINSAMFLCLSPVDEDLSTFEIQNRKF